MHELGPLQLKDMLGEVRYKEDVKGVRTWRSGKTKAKEAITCYS